MNNSIIPATKIGGIYIGWTYDRVVENLTKGFKREELNQYITLQAIDVEIWIDKIDEKVTQIMACDKFEGEFLGEIGIGDCLGDLLKLGVRYKYIDYVYELPDFPGICFELEDVEDWSELTAPIRFISIYKHN
jgi:hypothetical protein